MRNIYLSIVLALAVLCIQVFAVNLKVLPAQPAAPQSSEPVVQESSPRPKKYDQSDLPLHLCVPLGLGLGIVEAAAAQPMQAARTAIQSGQMTPGQFLDRVRRNPSFLARGLRAQMYGGAFNVGCAQFPMYWATARYLSRDGKEPTPFQKTGAALSAGLASGLVYWLSDGWQTLAQKVKANGAQKADTEVTKAVKELYRNHGWRGIGAGLLPALMVNGIWCMCTLAAGEQAQAAAKPILGWRQNWSENCTFGNFFASKSNKFKFLL